MNLGNALKRPWRTQIAGAKTATNQILAADKNSRLEHEDALAQRTRHRAAQPARADIGAGIVDLVAARAARWIETNGGALVALGALGGGLQVSIDGQTVTVTPPSVPAELDAAISFDLLCALAPAFVKDGLRAIVAATPKYSPGDPIADRPRLDAEDAQRISEIETEHSVFVDAAKEAGIEIPLLEEVRSRRAAAAHKADYDARQAADLKRKFRA